MNSGRRRDYDKEWIAKTKRVWQKGKVSRMVHSKMKILKFKLTPSVIEEKRRDAERNMTEKKRIQSNIKPGEKKKKTQKSVTNEIFNTNASDLHSLPCVANSSFSAVRLTHPAAFPALESSDSLLLAATILNCDLCSLALNTDLCSPALKTGFVGLFFTSEELK